MKNLLRCFAAATIVGMTACGGAPAKETESPVSETAEAYVSAPAQAGVVVRDITFTTAVDSSGIRAAAPASEAFLPDTESVYLITSLENLPTESDIEVRWTEATMGPPISVTHEDGSGTRTFSSRFALAKFAAADKKAVGKKIQALIFVNGNQVGGDSFAISDRRSGGMLRVKELAVSSAVEADTNLPVQSSKSFRKGTRKVIASFYIGGLEPGAAIRVRWLNEGDIVQEDDIESEGEKRYIATLESKKGLAFGDWAVEVDVLGDVLAGRSFYMGDESSGPAVEEAALGTAVGKNRMPKKAKTVFNTKPGAIHCGIRFLYAPAGAKVAVRWISMAEGTEDILQTTETMIDKEGTTAVNMAWRPGKPLKAGPYRAIIEVDGTKVQELPFEIK